MKESVRVLEPGQSRRKGLRGGLLTIVGPGRYITNIMLACFAVALEAYYSVCGGSCSYLQGDLAGIPLQYVGIVYMACVVLLSILKIDILLLMLLSAGAGIELYLIGFQIWHATYCPYCLAFGGVVYALFALNFTKARKRLAIIAMAAALILFSLLFEGSVTPSYAQEPFVPTFGRGKINVRLYTDYFCAPCRSMEPDAEPLLADLVKRNKVKLTFIDTPLHRYSTLYAKYYLYAMNGKRDFKNALTTRAALIEGAKAEISDPAQIMGMLASKGVSIKPFDPAPTFEVFKKYLKEDGITATPTCVIENFGKKEKMSGKDDIIKALKGLM